MVQSSAWFYPFILVPSDELGHTHRSVSKVPVQINIRRMSYNTLQETRPLTNQLKKPHSSPHPNKLPPAPYLTRHVSLLSTLSRPLRLRASTHIAAHHAMFNSDSLKCILSGDVIFVLPLFTTPLGEVDNRLDLVLVKDFTEAAFFGRREEDAFASDVGDGVSGHSELALFPPLNMKHT